MKIFFIVELSIINRITKLLSTSRKSSRSIMTDVLQEFVQLFKNLIWSPRCDKVVEWEKHHNIDAKTKRSTNLTRHITRTRISTSNTRDDHNSHHPPINE